MPPAPDPRRDAPQLPMIHVPFGDEVTVQLLRRRIVVVTGRLDAEASAQVASRLLLLDADRQDPLTVHFSCTEAELNAATALASTLELLRSEATVIAVGPVERAAIGVFAAGRVRRAHPHATFLLADPSPAANTDDVRLAAELHERGLGSLHARIAAASGREVAAVAADMHAGRLLSAAEAVDYGLVQSLTA